MAVNISSLAHAIVLAPIEDAAERLGFQLVGEIEFERGAVMPPAIQTGARVADVSRLCPSLSQPSAEPVRLMILSWPDQEYPAKTVSSVKASARRLADGRGRAVARELRGRMKGELSFELVNMATRAAQTVMPGSRVVDRHVTDVKTVLVDAGAAPTSPWEFGLFGEYAQKSKSVVWVDCDAHVSTQRAER